MATVALQDKHRALIGILSAMESALVAFSGGVDSTLLLAVAHSVLGARSLAVTADSPTLPASERADAERIARELGISHVLVDLDELAHPEFVANTPERCYHCKKVRFAALASLQQAHGLRWVLDGTNADDEGDWRPGIRAAAELGIRSPLKEAGFTKDDIRRLSAELGLANWDKPSAACLASRIPYGEAITRDKLRQVEEAEAYLTHLGFGQLRVRHHGDLARIEVARERMEDVLAHADSIASRLKRIGFHFVSLDLCGFASGSMNAALGIDSAQTP